MPTKGTGWGIETPTARGWGTVLDGQRMLMVSDHEFGLIITGLRKLRGKLARDMRRQEASGFEPAPGCIDLAKAKAKTLAALMDRLGINAKGERR